MFCVHDFLPKLLVQYRHRFLLKLNKNEKMKINSLGKLDINHRISLPYCLRTIFLIVKVVFTVQKYYDTNKCRVDGLTNLERPEIKLTLCKSSFVIPVSWEVLSVTLWKVVSLTAEEKLDPKKSNISLI